MTGHNLFSASKFNNIQRSASRASKHSLVQFYGGFCRSLRGTLECVKCSAPHSADSGRGTDTVSVISPGREAPSSSVP